MSFILKEVSNNQKLRRPQKEAFTSIREHYKSSFDVKEVGLILPVGCGKSGLIAITPYATEASRVLVIAPGKKIRDQLLKDLKFNEPDNFYKKSDFFSQVSEYPEVCIIEAGGKTNIHDIKGSDIVVSNIQQISGDDNKWLSQLDEDFFDLIIIDEAHHNKAATWVKVKESFPHAKVINYSATPMRSDGLLMSGEIIYSFSILEAIQEGYIKKLRAKIINPSTLSYLDKDKNEITLNNLEEIIRLGEEEATFRRGILMSSKTLDTLVQLSITELNKLRDKTGDKRLKIIASALNHKHCIQIKEAFTARNMRADYVHSNEDSSKNDKVFTKLDNHELDVIIQSKMLGEGFDHKYLSVAMVGSIFSNLSPFVQFVGRIMRVITQNDASAPENEGVVIFHAGANIAKRWSDFREFSEADQNFFSELLPEAEEVSFDHNDVIEKDIGSNNCIPIQVTKAEGIMAAELTPIGGMSELQKTMDDLGLTPLEVIEILQSDQRLNKQDQRRAGREALNDLAKHNAAQIIADLGLKNQGRNFNNSLDNYTWMIREIHSRVNSYIGCDSNERADISLEQIQKAKEGLARILEDIKQEWQNSEI